MFFLKTYFGFLMEVYQDGILLPERRGVPKL